MSSPVLVWQLVMAETKSNCNQSSNYSCTPVLTGLINYSGDTRTVTSGGRTVDSS